MGTTYIVTVVARLSESELSRLRARVHEALDDVDTKMSTYSDQSEVSRFNRSMVTEWFPISSDTLRVFLHAQAVGRLSGGAFDVTVAPLVDAWGFGPAGRPAALPTDREIAELLADVGSAAFELDDETSSARKTRPGTRIDLSALAKGYGVDQVVDLLAGERVEGYLVEVGGEVRARGHNENGRPWRVGIERPADGPSSILRVVELEDMALATSGDYRNYFEHQGRRYSHTIDPRTGYPVDHGLASVSVVDELCVRADALATALEVLGPEDGFALATARGWAALLVTRGDDGSLSEQATPQFFSLLAPSNDAAASESRTSR